MNKLNFDGKRLEGKNVEKKIRDIFYEMDFSGNEQEEDLYYNSPISVYYHKRKFIHYVNCN